MHIYGLRKHMADADDDVTHYEAVRDADEVPTSLGRAGRAAARSARHRPAARPSREPPERGQVTNLPDGVVVEIMGTVDARRRAPAATPRRCRRAGRVPAPRRAWRRSSPSTPRSPATASPCSKRCSPTRWPAAPVRRRRRDDRRDAHGHGTVAPAVRSHRRVDGTADHVIGGGSYQWVPKLLIDLVNMPSLVDAEIVIEDIDPAPLPRMVDFVEHIAKARASRMKVSGTTDQRDALEGADYVVVCISTGGFASMAPRPRDPRALRHQAVGRRHRRARRHHPRAAQHPGAGRHRARHGSASAPTRGCSTSPTR